MAVNPDALRNKIHKMDLFLTAEEINVIDHALTGLQRPSGPFICGYGGEMRDWLHDSYHICPAHGSDIVVIYKRAS